MGGWVDAQGRRPRTWTSSDPASTSPALRLALYRSCRRLPCTFFPAAMRALQCCSACSSNTRLPAGAVTTTLTGACVAAAGKAAWACGGWRVQRRDSDTHSTAQHSTAQHSTAQHSTAQHDNRQVSDLPRTALHTLHRHMRAHARRTWSSASPDSNGSRSTPPARVKPPPPARAPHTRTTEPHQKVS